MAEQMRGMVEQKQDRLLRLKHVLMLVPVSKSTWWAGCATGRFPKPIHLGPRLTCWLESEVLALIHREG